MVKKSTLKENGKNHTYLANLLICVKYKNEKVKSVKWVYSAHLRCTLNAFLFTEYLHLANGNAPFSRSFLCGHISVHVDTSTA